MLIEDIAWSAGIYEGEGNCKLVTFKNKHAPRKYIRPTIVVSSTDLDVLEKLKRLWGGSIWAVKKWNPKSKKQLYYWTLTFRKARNFVSAIYPYLMERRKKQLQIIFN